MSAPRSFRVDELIGAGGGPIGAAELAESVAAARELEWLLGAHAVEPRSGFVDRVMSALPVEPPLVSVTRVRPAARQGTRWAAVLLAAALATLAGGLAIAGAMDLFSNDQSPAPSPAVIESPSPSPSPPTTVSPTPSVPPSPPPSVSPAPSATVTAEPTETETAEPTETPDGSDDSGGNSGPGSSGSGSSGSGSGSSGSGSGSGSSSGPGSGASASDDPGRSS